MPNAPSVFEYHSVSFSFPPLPGESAAVPHPSYCTGPQYLLIVLLFQESNRILSWVGDHYHIMNRACGHANCF
ncbi:MAG: hypothetical protein MJE68_00465, partial [Proteobacteria bacterium]|nr:hypothetical protein [Pseudomonadota bacterium]